MHLLILEVFWRISESKKQMILYGCLKSSGYIGITFLNHRSKSVFNGRDLRKLYRIKTIFKRCNNNESNLFASLVKKRENFPLQKFYCRFIILSFVEKFFRAKYLTMSKIVTNDISYSQINYFYEV